MKGIGGNVYGVIQVKTNAKNAIGEQAESWEDVQTLPGWLDLINGDSKFTVYHAKIQESTHVFVADYTALDTSIKPETARMIINGKRYTIKLIDNPMEMNKQLEIYLSYTGGQ